MISVIIPVYNAEKYLSKCIESVLSQTYRDLEIILVNDGSTDESEKILDKYRIRDSRIVVINKENGGASTARNAGLDIAQGEYIAFVDADDTISPYYFEILHNCALNDGSDFVCYRYKDSVDVFEDYDLINSLVDERVIVDSRNVLKEYENKYYSIIWGVPFNKLFHKSLFDDIRFTEGMIYEDVEILPKLIKASHQLTILPMELYYYNYSENSVMRSGFSEKRFNILDLWKSHFYFFMSEKMYDYANIYLLRYMTNLIKFRKLVKETEFRQYAHVYEKYLNDFKKHKREYNEYLSSLEKNNLLHMAVMLFPTFPYISGYFIKLLNR